MYYDEDPAWLRKERARRQRTDPPMPKPSGPFRPPFVSQPLPPVPNGCAGYVRKFRKKGYGSLLSIIERLDAREYHGGLNEHQVIVDGRQRRAAQYLIDIHDDRSAALAAYIAIGSTEQAVKRHHRQEK